MALTTAPAESISSTLAAAGNHAASYAKGQCTYGVAELLSWVPGGLGNANQWIANAAKKGLSVSQSPSVGDVVVYSGGTSAATAYSQGAEYSSLGHVAVVTALGQGGTFTVSEMNYNGDGGGMGKYDTRQSSLQNVQGFIQPPGGSPSSSSAISNSSSSPSSATDLSACAWQGPFGWCILNKGQEAKFYGALLMGAGGLILLVGAGLVIIGALKETKLGKAAAQVAGATGVGKVVGVAAAPVKAVQGQRQQRTARAGAAQQQQQSQARTAASDSHTQAVRRAQLRTRRAQARLAEGRAKNQNPARTRTTVRTRNPLGGGQPGSYSRTRQPVQNQAKYDRVFGD